MLLTNDDGHEAPGIRSLQSALKEAGHRVSMVAPSNEQSASSMSITSRRNMPLEQLDENSWHLDGLPVDTILVALRHLLEDEPPDLVMSGVNFGPNLGIGLHMSGTMGAAVMATLCGIPSIAISAGMNFHEFGASPRWASTYPALDAASTFACSVIESLQKSHDPSENLLPAGILLNINYPAIPPDQIKGVSYPEVSSGHLAELGYQTCDKTGQLIPRYYPGVDPERPHEQEGDVRAHLEGYMTVSPVRPSWNPHADQAETLRRRLQGIGCGIDFPS